MEISLNSANFETLYQQVIYANSSDDLPAITIHLHRPTVTFNFILLIIMSLFFLWIGLSAIQQLLTQGLASFTDSFSIIVPLILLLIIMAFAIVEIKTQKLKLFKLNTSDIYLCRLTPNYFEWRFNDKGMKLDWQRIFIIEKFMTQRMEQARIYLGIENSEPLIIYHNHLPVNYRKAWQLMYDYQIRALGKTIIKIK